MNVTQASSTTLLTKIDPNVFKVKDSRIDRLRSAKMSIAAFCMSITEQDPFILIGDTVYVLTPQEYYARKALEPQAELSEKAFREIVYMDDISFMHNLDKAFMDKVRKELPTCRSCKYKQYKHEVYKLAKKYNIQLPGVADIRYPDIRPYPETTGEILPVVSALTSHMYKTFDIARKDCIDCVEKHIAQAYILGNECMTGYPEHLPLVVGHLAEALDEMPRSFIQLHDTVEYCLAVTNKDRKPFVPLQLILPLINIARDALNQSMKEQTDAIHDSRTDSMDIDITEDIVKELEGLPCTTAKRLRTLLDRAAKITLEYKMSGEDADRVIWEGLLATAAGTIAHIATATANMIRNRRLLFIGDPGLLIEAGYGFEDICKHLPKD